MHHARIREQGKNPDREKEVAMMNLTRWEPFREFEKLPEQMVRLFGFPTIRPYTAEEALTVADFMPPVDIYETEKEYLIKLDLPELTKEEVKVFVEDGVLSIQGERKKEKEEKGKKFLRIERSYGTFLRTFTVPPDADDTKIDAEFKEGLLKVHLPKSEKAKPKTIDVKVF
jgi:HSP20 family protein